jgi:threonine aldolase
MYGGSMRQAGHLAAAGLFGFERNRARLLETHIMAKAFADHCAARYGSSAVAHGGTNIVILSGTDTPSWADELATEKGMMLSRLSPQRVRAVFHFDVDGDAFLSRIASH